VARSTLDGKTGMRGNMKQKWILVTVCPTRAELFAGYVILPNASRSLWEIASSPQLLKWPSDRQL